ncbi:hypothetical protein [Flammeovirga kamogawensis]|uniref:Uncharacterized protein n=1 Tax=Flammeovirga kamogawensis TaxID=373891 RepID=A0ABX8H588_9BACT|nr:hypothetical protein [Flammeovirga kamogawensis]MBB6463547.1 putative nucleic acid-binding Zn-ribbon protein [Flammeovirga kamogawensis]QWG10602.1 hypothetical protein KM029_24785 [Flammeovirga kamogawensis]TRX63707.1 hypothetical protein EO216_25165 [Flammeovirga kamogawensis]
MNTNLFNSNVKILSVITSYQEEITNIKKLVSSSLEDILLDNEIEFIDKLNDLQDKGINLVDILTDFNQKLLLNTTGKTQKIVSDLKTKTTIYILNNKHLTASEKEEILQKQLRALLSLQSEITDQLEDKETQISELGNSIKEGIGSVHEKMADVISNVGDVLELMSTKVLKLN